MILCFDKTHNRPMMHCTNKAENRTGKLARRYGFCLPRKGKTVLPNLDESYE